MFDQTKKRIKKKEDISRLFDWKIRKPIQKANYFH